MTGTNQRIIAGLGSTFTAKVYGPISEPAEYEVKPACDGGGPGMWMCITHGKTFRHNFERDGHCSNGKTHVITWVCLEHGPEVP